MGRPQRGLVSAGDEGHMAIVATWDPEMDAICANNRVPSPAIP